MSNHMAKKMDCNPTMDENIQARKVMPGTKLFCTHRTMRRPKKKFDSTVIPIPSK